MELEFRKLRKRDLEPQETGYYFKGEFVHKHFNKSLDILRNKISHLPLEEKKKTDEWKVIKYYYDRQTEITKKIHNKKKGYYKKINERVRQNRIFKMEQKIYELEERKNNIIKDIIKDFDERTEIIKSNIKKLNEL